jgi:hypothetical protein
MDKRYKNIDVDELKQIVYDSDTFVEVTKKLGFDDNINARKNIERIIKRLNIPIEHFSSVIRVKESKIKYKKENLINLCKESSTFKEMLLKLDLLPIESNYKTLKKYLQKYNIDYSNIKTKRNSTNKAKYDEINLRNIISSSLTFREVLKKLELDTHGNNYKTIHKYINKYNIDISHFNPNLIRANKLHAFNKIPTEKILVENSEYVNTNNLKNRLYKEELKERKCELCGQDENWCGKHMSLILDHINGINNDHRYENLRIVCPNCNATLPTHCGKNMLKIKY